MSVLSHIDPVAADASGQTPRLSPHGLLTARVKGTAGRSSVGIIRSAIHTAGERP